ncbi:MAG TPA: polysaccharide biosynthesis tyrosine autokinase [Longimicrobiaceae bacterium]|nr:polysaccharide biosynthesis tyrosine autokinase [Longimicrobiaceae bacterium]
MSEYLTPSGGMLPAPNGGGHPPRNGIPAPPPEMEETPLRKYAGALRRQLWLVVLVGLVGLGIAYYAVTNTERMYTSRAVLQLADEKSGPSLGGGLAGLAASLGGGGSNIQSQLQVMRSRILLGEVVDSLGLRLQRVVPGLVHDSFEPTGIVDQVHVPADARPDTLGLSFAERGVTVRKAGQEVTAPYGEPLEIDGIRFTVPARPGDRDHLTLHVISRDDAVDVLIDAVRPASREGTNVVDVVVNGYDSIIPKKVANTTAEYYKQFSSRRSREQARLRRQFVMNQLAVAESLLTVTQAQLTEYRKREQLFSAKTEATMQAAGRGELEVRRAEMEAERKIFRSTLAELAQADGRRRMHLLRALASGPGVGDSPVIGSLYGQVSSYEAQRDSVLAGPPRRSPTHPEVLAIDSMRVAAEARLIGAARSYVDMLDARIAALSDIKGRTDRALAHIAESEPEEVRLMLQMESIGEAARELRARYYTAGMAEASEIDQVTILDHALAGDRSGSGPNRTLFFGLVFGLMVGGAGAILLDGANRSLRRREELEHFLRVPGLGVIPRLDAGGRPAVALPFPGRLRNGNGRGAGRELVAATQVHSSVAEAFRSLRTNLVFAPGVESLRSLVVTSPEGSEGKTTTAANLAVAFAQQGMRVLLVDCDLRRPRIHTVFGVAKEPGLADLLVGRVAAEQVIRRTSVERLSVLPAGSAPSVGASDLFGGGVVRSLVAALGDDFDLVIMDTAPVLVAANAAILGTQADGALLVVRAGRTERDAARQAVQQLSAVGVRVVGAVLNDPDDNLRQPRRYEKYYRNDPAPV